MVLVVFMIIKFYKIDKRAGLLQIPYLLWLCFAFYLNLSIYLLN
ncbi:MAG TPA: tryptophan-rich sensory protein [Bacilli bacterium]|nr:tryptophan-rich sensory protein [Bacilli bacterium]